MMGLVLIFIAVFMIIAGEVFLGMLYNNGAKIIRKYDANNSDVQCSDTEEFVSKINSMSGFGAAVMGHDEKNVRVTCQNNQYSVNVENGVAYVEHDLSGCGLRVTAIGRLFKAFRFCKVSKRAAVINCVMDAVAGRDITESQMGGEKVSKNLKSFKVTGIIAIVCFIAGVFLMKDSSLPTGSNSTGSTVGTANSTAGTVNSDDNKKLGIKNVKTMPYKKKTTYGEVIDSYLKSPVWDVFESKNNEAIVEVTGTGKGNEAICIQFAGKKGKGLEDLAGQKFKMCYAEVDDESYNPKYVMKTMYKCMK